MRIFAIAVKTYSKVSRVNPSTEGLRLFSTIGLSV